MVWSPVYTKDKISIENIQKHAIKLVKRVSHLPYNERLSALGLPTLEYQHERADVTQVSKILHDIDKIDKNKLFTMSDHNATCCHSLKLIKCRSRLQVRVNFFQYNS